MAFTYAGKGILFPFTSIETRGTLSYSWKPVLGERFYYHDFGSITEPPIDSWVIQNHANVTIQDHADDRIVDLVYTVGGTSNYIDHGDVAEPVFKDPEYDWGYITVTSDITVYGTFRLSSLTQWSVHKAWVGTGQIFERGRGITRLVAPYHTSGTVRVSGAARTFYVPSVATWGILPLRSLTAISYTTDQQGTGTLSTFSGVAEAVGYNPVEEQALFSIYGTSGNSFTPNWVSQGTVKVYDQVTEKFSPHYQGSGRLPVLTSFDERFTYSYSSTSHEIFDYKDYGSITNPIIDSWVIQAHANTVIETIKDERINELVYSTTAGSYLDYQYLLQDGAVAPVNVREDYEYIWQTFSRYAMGLCPIKGTAGLVFSPSYYGSGTINVSGHGRGRVKPRWVAYVRIKVQGDAKTNFSLLSIGSGRLFNFASADERRTFGWTTTGSIWSWSGAAEAVGANPPDITTHLKVSGHGHASFTPNWNSHGTVNVGGQLVEKQTDHYAGYGILPTFSGGADTLTKHYSLDSEELFEYRDYGSVADPIVDSWVIQAHANTVIETIKDERIINLVYSTTDGSYEDYGFGGLHGSIDGTQDYEYIWQTYSRYPFGDLIFGGAAKTNFSLGHLGSGTVNVYGKGRGRTKPRWVGYVRVRVQGASKTNFSLLHIGDGNLFSFASGEESRTYDWVGTGNLYTINGASESSGATPPITTTDIKVSGYGHASFTPNWNGRGTVKTSGTRITEKYTSHWTGSGTLFNFEEAEERRTYHYSVTSEEIFEYRDYGSVAEEVVDSWVIQAHANTVIETIRDERIIDLVYSTTEGNYFDYLYLEGDVTDRQDYEYIWQTFSRYPMGDIVVGGAAKTNFSLGNIGEGRIVVDVTSRYRPLWRWIAYVLHDINGIAHTTRARDWVGSGSLFTIVSGEEEATKVFTGSGSLFGFGGAAESIGARPPLITTDLKITGYGHITYTPNWNSQGTLPVYGTAIEKYAPHYEGSGILYDFSGVKESRVFDYNGGSIDWFTSRDYGSVSQTPLDSWVIQNHANETIQSLANDRIVDLVYSGGTTGQYFDCGNIEIPQPILGMHATSIHAADGIEDYQWIIAPDYDGTVYPFGGLHITGSAYVPITFRMPVVYEPAVKRADINIGGAVVIYFPPFHEGKCEIQVYGAAKTTFSLLHVGTGQIFSGGLGGEATTIKLPPMREAHILFSGRAITLFSLGHVGSGLIRVSGDAVYTASKLYTGSGFIKTLSGAAESTTSVPPTEQVLFRTSGYAAESTTVGEVGTGRLYGFGGASESILSANVQEGLFIISGAATEKQTGVYVGTGGFWTWDGASESTTFSPDEEQVLFTFRRLGSIESFTANPPEEGTQIHISGTTYPELLTFAEQPEVLSSIFGTRLSEKSTSKWIGRGDLFAIGGAAESVTFNPPDITTLFDITGLGRETITFNPPEEGTEIILSGTSGDPLLTFTESGVGSLFALVSGEEEATKVFVGSGVIFSSGFGGEARTIKLPPMREAHILFSGASEERVTFDPPEIGTHILLSGAGVETYTPNWNGSGIIPLFGQGLESHTEVFTGDGQIFSNGIGGESITVKVPAVQADLYFTGTRISERTTVSESGFGFLSTFSGAAVTTSVTGYSGGLFTVYGAGSEATSITQIGDGQIFSNGFGGEARTIKLPPMREAHILFSGSAVERTTKSEIKSIETLISGAAFPVIFIPHWRGEGTVDVYGAGHTSTTKDYIGTGQIFSGGLGGEARTIRLPPMREAHILFGGSRLAEKTTVVETGSGSLWNWGDAAIVLTFSPEGGGLFQIDGIADESFARIYTGSGSLYAISGAAESTTIIPPTEQVLFNVSGLLDERVTKTFEGDGRLWGWGGSAETLTFSPDEEQVLFYFTGFGRENVTFNPPEGFSRTYVDGEAYVVITYNWHGKGLVDVYGAGHTTRTRVYTGSGSLYAIAGASESYSVTVDVTGLFTYVGEAEISRTISVEGIGYIFSNGFGGESRTIKLPPTRDADVLVTGESTNALTKRYAVDPETIEVYGSADESFTRHPYDAEARIATDGEVLESIAKTVSGQVEIDVSGEVSDIKLTFAEFSSGSLWSWNGGDINVTYDYTARDGVLYISGEAKTNPPTGYWRGRGDIRIFIDGETVLVKSSPPRTYGWIV